MKKSYYKGILPIGSLELDCYVLDDEQNTRILSSATFFKAFNRPQRGNREKDPVVENMGKEVLLFPTFTASKALQPYLTKEIEKDENMIKKFLLKDAYIPLVKKSV